VSAAASTRSDAAADLWSRSGSGVDVGVVAGAIVAVLVNRPDKS
jgi:hypothetical protein